ncbi:MAG: hypothetical protein WA660_14590 [Candidatus Acidiferrales bacterium]
MREKVYRCGGVIGLLLVVFAYFLYNRTVRAANDYMFLTVRDFEQGVSYHDAQWHAPIGMATNPCSYADTWEPSIDWNDGTGPHKPDTNAVTTMFQKTTPVIQNGVYLFWDDGHTPGEPGERVVTTKLTVHCVGDPPGNQEYVTQNRVNVFARIPVNDVEFTKDGKPVATVKGHDTVDLTITLDGPARASGTWVKLEVSPAGNLNTLPPYYRVSPGATQETIRNLEVRKPAENFEIAVTASTVGRAQETRKLTVTP